MRRRAFIQSSALAGAFGSLTLLTGCQTVSEPEIPHTFETFSDSYGARKDGKYNLPAIPIKLIDQAYHRQIVRFRTSYPPGTIIVNTPKRFLYLIMRRGRAMRYGISVGRAGFAWEGEAYIQFKREWPRWTPPPEMVQRQPKYAKYAQIGMAPGLRNPLGARALYLYDRRTLKDTLYRLHGTPEWRSIGKAASSGCIRLINQDIIDLYDRVEPGMQTKVVVIQ